MKPFKISHNLRVRSLQIVNHMLFIVGIFYLIYNFNYTYIYIALGMYYINGILGINIGYHRLLSHKSFVTHSIIEKMLTVFGTLTAVGSSLAWVSIHRKHHRFSDSDNDPHSPNRIGKLNAWFGFWIIENLETKYIQDLKKSKFHRYIHKKYLETHLLFVLLLFLIDPWLVIFAYAVPSCLVFHSASAGNLLGHAHGYRTYNTKDFSTNSWISNLITAGEGWHNNHHAAPWKWDTQEKWWEWDLPAYIIRLIKK